MSSQNIRSDLGNASFSLPKAVFSVLTYSYFFLVFLMLGAFQLNLSHHFSIFKDSVVFDVSVDYGRAGESPPLDDTASRIIVNTLMLGVFALHHSIFARRTIKNFLINSLHVPADIERTLYVLVSSALAHIAMVFWSTYPTEDNLWGKSDNDFVNYLGVVFGMLFVLLSTFMIDHFDLFGLRQGLHLWPSSNEVKTIGFYKLIRHPIMTGFLIMFWARPILTFSSLQWNILTTGYIFIGTTIEEYCLIQNMGEDYVDYKSKTYGLFPGCPFGIPMKMARRLTQ
jgi:protein-S-isoprenylcysteine O-methyltransferase Ste14|tara:strand:- start:7547 stop:8395 length:849 start_codon:yes stop_codon:yes gene_type:complete